tara:strand:+ start:168 stop:515 length:348 start_codon:yes stop_codon:yes gene_type:complete
MTYQELVAKALTYRKRELVGMSDNKKYAIAMELGVYNTKSFRADDVAEAVTVEDFERYLLRYDNQRARRHGIDVWTVTEERHEFEASQVSDFERAYSARYSAQYAEHIRNTPLPE